MTIDWWTLGLQAVNFLVLVWLLQRFLYRPVLAAIDRRRAQTLAAKDKALAAERRAEAAEREALAHSEALQAEAAQLRRQALDDGAKRADELVAAARGDAQHLLDEARRALAEERRQATEDLENRAADVAATLAGRLLAEAAPGVGAGPFLAALADRLSRMNAEERAAFTGGALTVETAPPLAAAEQDEWRRRLLAALGAEAPLAFAEAPELIAGARLVAASATLSVSWADALAAAKGEMGHDQAG